MKIVLYYSPGSCSFAPHVILNEIGLPFELRKFSTMTGENFSKEYLAINSKGRIPALFINDFLLTENSAILAYLGRNFPDANVYPNTTAEDEARCLEWLAWCTNTAHLAYAQIYRPERFINDEAFYPLISEKGAESFQDCLSFIDDHLKNSQYAVGDQFTVVDPFWLVFFGWGARQGYKMKVNYPNYTKYAEELDKRDSVRTTLESEGISLWK